MCRTSLLLILLLSLIATTACGGYRARVSTGLPPGDARVEESWRAGFLGGIIGPAPLDVSDACPDGVSLVENRVHLGHAVVSLLTFSLYAPMRLHVTCAAAPGAEPSS